MRPTRAAATALCALALAGTAAGCSTADHSSHASNAASTQATGRDADVMFAQMMIPHHEQAVTMSDIAITVGAGPEVTQLATAIKSAQDPEIQQMHQWLTDWGAAHQMDHGDSSMDMPGMLTDEQLDQLRAARGTAFDRLWMELMIEHHEGAIGMAQEVLATTSDSGVKKLAQDIVAGQTAEISQMKALLNG
jgi:hypothetical protein